MTCTPYKKSQGDFSQRAHKAAEKFLYPAIFRASPGSLTFDETLFKKGGRAAVLDADFAIDCVVKHKIPEHKFPIVYTVQERFRRALPKYLGYNDVTITAVNKLSGKPAELYKMGAQFFLYALYDESNNFFPKAIAFETAPVLRSIARNELEYLVNGNDRRQEFIAINIDELFRIGAVFWHYPYGEVRPIDFVSSAQSFEVLRPEIVPSELVNPVRRVANWIKHLQDIAKSGA